MQRSAFGRLMAALIAIQIGHAWAGGGSGVGPAAEGADHAPTLTVKERLSSKASDEQRVDNCKVPVELRGPKPRSDHCSHMPSSAPTRWNARSGVH